MQGMVFLLVQVGAERIALYRPARSRVKRIILESPPILEARSSKGDDCPSSMR
jgi:hypothetical protein